MMKLFRKLFSKNQKENNTKKLESMPKEFLIKAKLNNKGEKIYHVPGGRFYEQVKPTELFADITAAEDAGYRKSKQ